MDNQEQKELAEWAAEWLGLERLQNSGEWKFRFMAINFLLDEESFFDNDFGPILAHLAKRKMEEMGFDWCVSCTEKGKYSVEIGPTETFQMTGKAEHENEYIALWTAIREAVKG